MKPKCQARADVNKLLRNPEDYDRANDIIARNTDRLVALYYMRALQRTENTLQDLNGPDFIWRYISDMFEIRCGRDIVSNQDVHQIFDVYRDPSIPYTRSLGNTALTTLSFAADVALLKPFPYAQSINDYLINGLQSVAAQQAA